MDIIKSLNQDDDVCTSKKGILCDDPCAEHLLRTGGYCKLLGEAGHWEQDAVNVARQLLQSEMAFVPDGTVELQNIAVSDGADECGVVWIEEGSFYIDRHAVTNAQFKRFVDADAYRDETFWPLEIQPYVFQFVDRSGIPGPSEWSDGVYSPERRDHPVVGISWHEANAFANWIGKQLPTSSQWQRAGTWWNPSARFPWGLCCEPDRANIYSNGREDTVPVGNYENSATPNGILQLVGNVWEWVDACFGHVEFEGQMKEIESSLGEIRGGAFDTYLTSQATCVFRSGLSLLNRSRNVGFRCAANSVLLANTDAVS